MRAQVSLTIVPTPEPLSSPFSFRSHLTSGCGSPHQGLGRHAGRSCEDAVPQEVDPGPPIGLPFEQLQPLDKALRRPITPDEREPGAHGRFILEQPFEDIP